MCFVEERLAPDAPTAQSQASTVLSTLEADGSRRWLTPKPAFGPLWRRRRAVAYLLIALFTLLPYVTINGKPAVLLDIAARRFTLFGKTFLPTDTLLLALLVVGIFVTVFLATALAGRVWCGWGCPQTVYMEFLYRPLERFFSGTPGRAKSAFQRSAVSKPLKYIAYFAASCFLAHTFLAYFVGVDRLVEWVRLSPAEHPTPFLVMAITTGLMMFDFSYFREQTCIVACPYGRLQSVMLDRQSLIVSYDRRRGEPRGRKGKSRGPSAEPTAESEDGIALPQLNASPASARTADCVDCGMCVTCCPTGIDIRNGLQMECVNCTQCIDACDSVMMKLNRPTGLIRYSSQAVIDGEHRHLVRPRVILYPLVLVVLVTAFVIVLSRKDDTDVTVHRGLGAPFSVLQGGMIGNQIRVKIVNRREVAAEYSIAAAGVAGASVHGQEFPLRLEPGEMKMVPAIIEVPASSLVRGSCDVEIVVSDASGKEVSRRRHHVVGPAGAERSGSDPSGTAPDSTTGDRR